ncbi:MAG: hypothetical protein PHD86_00490 [Kiritimatiellae bacterium]|nr:hypothetical protein [Kiritimatiellia bacterium]
MEQEDRIRRLMTIIDAPDSVSASDPLEFYDVVIFACQNIWHLKDWVLNDDGFDAHDIQQLKDDIHNSPCLMICGDIANGSKHLSLTKSKTGSGISQNRGIHFAPKQGIHQEFWYLSCPSPYEKYDGMEIRPFLNECLIIWRKVISQHYLSKHIIPNGLVSTGAPPGAGTPETPVTVYPDEK